MGSETGNEDQKFGSLMLKYIILWRDEVCQYHVWISPDSDWQACRSWPQSPDGEVGGDMTGGAPPPPLEAGGPF